MEKPYNEKLKMLKGLLNGTKSLKEFRPPRHFIVYKECTNKTGDYVEDIHYSMSGINKKLNQVEYDEWCEANVRDEDTIIHLVECRNYGEDGQVLINGNYPLENNKP